MVKSLKMNALLHFFLSNCSVMHFMFSFSLEKVLEAITTAGEWRGIERFSPIVQGLRDRSVQLQVSAKYFYTIWHLVFLRFDWYYIQNNCENVTMSIDHSQSKVPQLLKHWLWGLIKFLFCCFVIFFLFAPHFQSSSCKSQIQLQWHIKKAARHF